MTGKPNFSGVIAPVLTPFGEDGTPDPDRFIEHAQWLLEDGCTGLAPFGTTSEANSLGLDERMELLEDLIDAGIEPSKLMPGTGACSITDAAILTQHAVDLGCGGVLTLPPFYYKNPSEEGLFRFFASLVEEVGDDRLKLYLYHIPPVAQVGFSLPLIGRLKKEFPDVVVGLKDSSGDWANTKSIVEAHPDLEIFPGAELFLLDGLRAGTKGVISATANVGARAMRRLYDNWQGPDADKLQADIGAMRKTVQGFPVIPALKALIAFYRDDPGWAAVRPPFEPLPKAEADRLIKTLADQHGFKLAFAEAA
jgi:4-hydroxy-tetrahydrodipicolinate synthase